MKRILVIMILSIFSITTINAQAFNLRVGIGLAKQLDKDEDRIYSDDYNTKLGLNAGFTYEAPISKSSFFEFGLGIESKGFQVKNEDADLRAVIGLQYITAPLMLKFTQPLKNGLRIYENIGAHVAYGISGKLKVGDYDFDDKDTRSINWGDHDSKDDYKPLDYGLSFGAGVENNSIQYGFLYDLGLANISTYTTDGTVVRNRAFKFYFGIKLGNKKSQSPVRPNS